VEHWGLQVREGRTVADGLDTVVVVDVDILADEGHRGYDHNRLGGMGSVRQVVDMLHVAGRNLVVGSHKVRENHHMIVVERHIAEAGSLLAEVDNLDRIGLVVESRRIAAAVDILHLERHKSLG